MSPLRFSASAVTIVFAATIGSGCVLTSEVGGSDNATPTTVGRPVQAGSIGTAVAHGGVTLTVLAVSSFDRSPEGTPRIKVIVHSENLADSARRNPDLRLVCDESSRFGDWYPGSTWEPNYLLPVNTVNEGEVIIGFPAKAENRQYPVARCSNPQLIAELGDPRSLEEQKVAFDVPSAVIAEALVRPRGPNLPLPAATDR